MKKQMELPVALTVIGLALLLLYCLKCLACLGGLPMIIGVSFIGVGVTLGICRLNQNSEAERIR